MCLVVRGSIAKVTGLEEMWLWRSTVRTVRRKLDRASSLTLKEAQTYEASCDIDWFEKLGTKVLNSCRRGRWIAIHPRPAAGTVRDKVARVVIPIL